MTTQNMNIHFPMNRFIAISDNDFNAAISIKLIIIWLVQIEEMLVFPMNINF